MIYSWYNILTFHQPFSFFFYFSLLDWPVIADLRILRGYHSSKIFTIFLQGQGPWTIKLLNLLLLNIPSHQVKSSEGWVIACLAWTHSRWMSTAPSLHRLLARRSLPAQEIVLIMIFAEPIPDEQVPEENVDTADQEEEVILSCQPTKKATNGRKAKKR